jgi:hypothetical protein
VASPRGIQDKTVKKGYSFTLNFAPNAAYRFQGWQAKFENEANLLASWESGTPGTPGGRNSNPEAVKFVPKNEDGTEMEIFVYVMPEKPEQRLVISPLHADSDWAEARIDFPGEWGQSSRKGKLEDAKLGFSFTVEFSANAAYFFSGWEAVLTEDMDAYLLVSENREDREEFINKTVNPEEKTKLVNITETKDAKGNPTGRAEITVLGTEALTLVPHCYRRPYIKTTSLPNSFTRPEVKNYPIDLYFSRPIKSGCLSFDNFKLSGVTNLGNDGIPLPDIKGNYDFLSLPQGEDETSRVSLRSKPKNGLNTNFSNLQNSMNQNLWRMMWNQRRN